MAKAFCFITEHVDPHVKKKQKGLVCRAITIRIPPISEPVPCKKRKRPKKPRRKKVCKVDVRRVLEPVNVNLSFNGDTDPTIRLAPDSAKVEAYGTDGRTLQPLRTDPSGRLEVVAEVVNPERYSEQVFTGTPVNAEIQSLPAIDTSNKSVVTFAVINRGPADILASLEISPNGVDFTTDSHQSIPAGSMKMLTPLMFLRWNRVCLRTKASGESSTADVYYQSHT